MSDFRDLDQLLQRIVKNGPAGCGCAVSQDGKLLFENYYGYSNLEDKTPITADSCYRLWSSTKVIVCTAAMMLFERGRFLLNDPIYDYFPEWKNTMVADRAGDGTYQVRPAKSPILVRDCFSMSMGIGYGGDDLTHQTMNKVREELRSEVGNYTLRQEIKAMSKVPVAFDPSTHWLYGYGHELVAGLIEVVSGMTVGEFLKKELFEPLGMEHTGYRYFGRIKEQMVTAYKRMEDGALKPFDQAPMDELFETDAVYEGGGAGLFSSVKDYLAFSEMLACGGTYRGNRLIGRKTIDLMRQNQLDEQRLKEFNAYPYLDGYGYGLGVRTMMEPGRGSNTSVGEFGWTGYMGTYNVIDPAERTAVVYMHNLDPNLEFYTHHRVRNTAFGCLK